MNRRLTGGALTAFSILVAVAWATPVRAQDPREEQVAQAFDEFDTARRLRLLTAALDPAAGPPSGAWPAGVQLLAQTLIEDGRDSLAGIYLRWAVRLSPEFQVDTVQFLPQVATAHAAAYEFVRGSRTAGDTLVTTTWLWPARGTSDTVGRLQVSAPSVIGPFRASVEGAGELAGGAGTVFAPGSYRVNASAPGYDSLAVTREVLPGVTTVLEFRPRRSAIAAAEPTPQPQIPPANTSVGEQRRKKFPLALLLGGVAAAGAVAVLAGGGDNPPPAPPTTGGITVTFPSP